MHQQLALLLEPTSLVTETTGKVTQHVNIQLSLRYIFIILQYNTRNVKIK